MVGMGMLVYTNLKGEQIEATYNRTGQFDEPVYDWGYGVTTPSIDQNLAAWQIPTWPNAINNGRVASWKVNNVAQDLSTYKGIVGPNVVFRNNNLRLQTASRFYNIDYTGRLPVFSTNLTSLLTDQKNNLSEPVLYPNPSNKSFQISISSAVTGLLKVSLFNTNGKLIRSFPAINIAEAGINTPSLSLANIPSGTYFCQIEVGKQKWNKRLVVVQ
jgi:hypothetical protein